MMMIQYLDAQGSRFEASNGQCGVVVRQGRSMDSDSA